MRFMLLVIPKGYEKAKAGTMPDPKLIEPMVRYNQELAKAGILLAVDGLHPPVEGTRVSWSGGKPKVKEGVPSGANEVVGGYWVIETKSKAEAVEWAKRAPFQDGDAVEIRIAAARFRHSPLDHRHQHRGMAVIGVLV